MEVSKLAMIVLWGNAIYHIIMGSLCLVDFQTLRGAMNRLYKANIQATTEYKFLYMLRPLGAFAITLSLINFWIVINGNVDIQLFLCKVLALLYFLRAFFRVRYYDLFFRAFNVKKKNNAINVTFNLILIAILLIN